MQFRSPEVTRVNFHLSEGDPHQKWKKPCDWQALEFQKWADKPVQGMGICWFKKAPESNAWLRKLPKVQNKFCTQALLLRANVYPTREFMSWGLPKLNARCRGCNARLESSSHVLGECRVVTTKRVETSQLCMPATGDGRQENGVDSLKREMLWGQVGVEATRPGAGVKMEKRWCWM